MTTKQGCCAHPSIFNQRSPLDPIGPVDSAASSVACRLHTGIARSAFVRSALIAVSWHGKGTTSTLVANVSAWRDVRAELAPYAAIPLRLIVGYGFLAHGLAKWFKGPEVFAGILQATGVPLPHLMAWVTIATEIVSGIAFLIGALVPVVSIPAIILLAVAIFTVHLPYGFTSIKLMSVNNGRAQFGPPGYECDLLYIACIMTLVLIGPTPLSLDRLWSPRSSQHKSLNN